MKPRGGDRDWGKGGYLIPDEFEILIYSESGNQIFGRLYTENSTPHLAKNNLDNINIDYGDIEYIGSYENEILKVKECFNPEFVQILWKTTNEVLYVNKALLEAKGAKYSTYKDILCNTALKENFNDTGIRLGINIKNNCLNLLNAPLNTAKKIICMHGNVENRKFGTELKMIEAKGDWVKVIYIEHHAPSKEEEELNGDCFSIEKNKKIGWVKAVDKNGFPNIWFSVSGY